MKRKNIAGRARVAALLLTLVLLCCMLPTALAQQAYRFRVMLDNTGYICSENDVESPISGVYNVQGSSMLFTNRSGAPLNVIINDANPIILPNGKSKCFSDCVWFADFYKDDLYIYTYRMTCSASRCVPGKIPYGFTVTVEGQSKQTFKKQNVSDIAFEDALFNSYYFDTRELTISVPKSNKLEMTLSNDAIDLLNSGFTEENDLLVTFYLNPINGEVTPFALYTEMKLRNVTATGDSVPLTLLMALMAASLVVLAVYSLRRRVKG